MIMKFGGAIPSSVDDRDWIYPTCVDRNIPATLDLTNSLTSVRKLGVAQAICCSKEYQERREINFRDQLSPQFIYNNRSNYPGVGMECRNGLKISKRLGIAQERNFVYGNPLLGDDIPERITDDALSFRIKAYARILFSYGNDGKPQYINNIDNVKQALVENGPTIIILPLYGVDTSFWKRKTNRDTIMGWEAFNIIGYNAEGFILRTDDESVIMSYSEYNEAPMHEHWTLLEDSNLAEKPKRKKECILM
jgi:hypothetical protein